MKKDLTVVFVDYKTAELSNIVIESFTKHVTDDFNVQFLIVENDVNYDLLSRLNLKDNVRVINRNTNSSLSQAHGEALEAAKEYIDTDYVFTCHSDVCVTSKSFYNELLDCIRNDVALAGVCIDKHPDRVKALHCSGLLVKSEIFKSVSLLPSLPTIDTADELTIYCRENNLKTVAFRNTYNDSDLVENCNSPFKELGKECGVDRCLDTFGKVMFVHQGRGTTKKLGLNNTRGKMSTEEWIKLTLPFTGISHTSKKVVTYSDVISNRKKIVDKFPIVKRKNRIWDPFASKKRVLHFGSGKITGNAHVELCSMFEAVASCDIDEKSGADYHSIDEVKEKFDLIVAEHVFEHITPQNLTNEIADKISSCLTSNGNLLVTVPNLLNFGGYFADFDHKNLAPPIDIAAIFCCFDLELVEIFRWSKSRHMLEQESMNDSEKFLESFLEKHYGLQVDKYVTMIFEKQNG